MPCPDCGGTSTVEVVSILLAGLAFVGSFYLILGATQVEHEWKLDGVQFPGGLPLALKAGRGGDEPARVVHAAASVPGALHVRLIYGTADDFDVHEVPVVGAVAVGPVD